MARRTTLKDIADHVGVSQMTVSLVLNKPDGETGIGQETRDKVLKAARKLNYRPNYLARGLRHQKTLTIGLIISDISNTFFARLARSVEDEANRHGYHVIFCSCDENPDIEKHELQLLKDRQVDGLIISSTQMIKEEIQILRNDHYPFVLIDRHFPRLNCNSVVVDNTGGTQEAIEHLIGMGHQKIGYLHLSPHLSVIKERLNGYKEAYKLNQMRIRQDYIRDLPFENLEFSVQRAIRELLNQPDRITALFCANNKITTYALKYLHRQNISVPRDMALISFDDEEAFELYDPPVTAVRQPVEDMGYKSVQILMEEINARGKMKSKKQIILPTKLIVRKSCGSIYHAN